MYQSLLRPSGVDDSQEVKLPADTIRDLGLEEIARAISQAGTSYSIALRHLTRLPSTVGEIEYRQSVMQSLWEDQHLCDQLRELLQSMKELTLLGRSVTETERPLLATIWRLGELELYVEVVNRLNTLLGERTLTSEALRLLAAEIAGRVAEPTFQALVTELPLLRQGLKLHQSVTIGVNLDNKLRPVEATLLSVNAQRYRQGPMLSGFLKRAGGDDYLTRTPIHQNAMIDPFSGAEIERVPLAPLFEELDSILKSTLKPLARELRKYLSVNTALIRGLAPELGLYLGAIDYFRALGGAEYPLSFPNVMEPEARVSRLTGLYNAKLAARRVASRRGTLLVGNDIAMDEHARLFVLTGPNGGGKTTFTQALGIAAVFGQAGLPVPAAAAELSPVDGIFTHFQTDENYDDEIGRFEDEARRISTIFDSVSSGTLVLLNEPLASTSPDEAEAINKSILESLRVAGARGVVTTHFHGLARACDAINSDVSGESDLATLTAGIRVQRGHVERTFLISEGDPSGQSYAGEISRLYGLDSDSLRARLSGRGERDEAGAS